jgi:hypothetical protein
MKEQSVLSNSLYDLLAEAAPLGPTAGETSGTKARETIDEDLERFIPQDLPHNA